MRREVFAEDALLVAADQEFVAWTEYRQGPTCDTPCVETFAEAEGQLLDVPDERELAIVDGVLVAWSASDCALEVFSGEDWEKGPVANLCQVWLFGPSWAVGGSPESDNGLVVAAPDGSRLELDPPEPGHAPLLGYGALQGDRLLVGWRGPEFATWIDYDLLTGQAKEVFRGNATLHRDGNGFVTIPWVPDGEPSRVDWHNGGVESVQLEGFLPQLMCTTTDWLILYQVFSDIDGSHGYRVAVQAINKEDGSVRTLAKIESSAGGYTCGWANGMLYLDVGANIERMALPIRQDRGPA